VTHVVGCTGKRKFSTRSMAEENTQRIAARHGGKVLRAYQCDACGCWHLTSVPPEAFKKTYAMIEAANAQAREKAKAILAGGFVMRGADGVQRRVDVVHVKRRLVVR